MSNVRINDVTLIERLKTEARTCPECRLEVRHPLVERCPRCFSQLPRVELGCEGCYHRALCPIAEEKREAPVESFTS